MNRSIFIAIILLFSSSVFAQSIEPIPISNKPFQIQAGINVIGFVRQFLNFSGNNFNTATSPYTLNLKVFKQIT